MSIYTVLCSFLSLTEGALLPPPSTSEWVSGYLSLADVMNKLQMKHEAAKVMQDAIDLFSGTPDEARWLTTEQGVLPTCRQGAEW